MRVIICGSRGWRDRAAIADRLFDLPVTSTIITGYDPKRDRPRGADRIAHQEAQKLGLLVEPHPAEWEDYTYEDYKRFGRKGAGRKRNEEMAEAGADLLIAFWDGTSPGTKDMIQRARDHEIPVEVKSNLGSGETTPAFS